MLNKICLILSIETVLISCSLIALESSAPVERIEIEITENKILEQERGWCALVKAWGGSIIGGALIGSVCGAGCAYIEDAIDAHWLIPITWFFCRTIRLSIIKSLLQDARKYKINHHRSAVYNSAWLADWVAYLSYRHMAYN